MKKNQRFSIGWCWMQTHDWAPVFSRLIEKERLSGDHLIIIALVRASHTTEWVFDFEKTAARRLATNKKSDQGRRLLLSSCGGS